MRVYEKDYFIICILCSCQTKYIRYPQGGIRPKKPNFKFSKNPYKLTSAILDTTAIYANNAKNVSLGKIHFDATSQFYRFFANGRVYVSKIFLKEFLTPTEYNDLRCGHVGYYKINNENELMIELFETTNRGRYCYYLGTIENNSIIIHTALYGSRELEYDLMQQIRLEKIKPHNLFFYSKADW